MIEEKGPWAAALGSNDRAFVESDDFTHDVRLYINGDFESTEQKLEYAEEIAKRLNTFARSTTHDKDKIISAAKEAGISYSGTMPEIFDSQDMLAKFYAIAFEDGQKAEREDCAKVCEALGADYKGRFGEDESLFLASSECADAIRARGDTK